MALLLLLSVVMLASSKPNPSEVVRDMGRLAPSFRARVELLLQRMRARGFRPLVWETYRSPERAAQLAAKGTGKVASLHIYGAAVDIVDERELWNASQAFKDALRDESESLGLVSGARFSHADPWHVQAVAVADERALRAAADPSAFVAERLA